MLMLKVLKACVVRAALLLHITMTVWRVTVDLRDDIYWLILLATIPFFIESLYTIIKRKGDDFLLFTPCFFFYLMATVPCVWLLELRKTDVYLEGKEEVLFNKTAEENPLGDLDINPNTWTILIEELLLYLLIISRWILPRGEVTREQLSELLFAFIGIASDIMEMFSLFGVDQVRTNRILSYCVLSVWSLSVTQFCMTLTVTHKPRRGKNIRMYDDNESDDKKKATISNEIIAIFLSMVMQDVPFVSVRLYTIITYNLITYSLVFFTSKNCLVICLLFYKVAVLLQKRYCPEKPKNDEETGLDQAIINGNGDFSGTNGNGLKQRKINSSDSGSSSRTGGLKEKEKLEMFTDIENESVDGKKSKNKSKATKKAGKLKSDSIASHSTTSKSDIESLKKTPSVISGNGSVNATYNPSLLNGNGKANSPEVNANVVQAPLPLKETTSSNPSPKTITSLTGPPKTAQFETKPATSQNSTPKTQQKQQANNPKNKKSPKQATQPMASTPKNVPTNRTPLPTNQTSNKQQKEKLTSKAINAIQQRSLPNPHQKAPAQKIAGGYGWISSKPKEENDFIVDGLS